MASPASEIAVHVTVSRKFRWNCFVISAAILGLWLGVSMLMPLDYKSLQVAKLSGPRRLQRTSSEYAPGSAPRTPYAFASLLWGNKADGLLDFLVLAHSLRRAGATSDILALLPEGDSSMDMREVLEAHSIRTVVVPRIDLPKSMVSLETSSKWRWVFSKFVAFNLTEYTKVALMDADMLQRGDINPEVLFDECGDVELCMALDVTPSLFRDDYNDSMTLVNMSNAGLMVLSPSAKRFYMLEAAIREEQHKYHLPEQQFISYYVLQPQHNMSFRYLGNKWNQCSECATANTALTHFMGDHKPHQFQLCVGNSSSRCSDALSEWHREWQRRLFEVEPCSMIATRDLCQQQSCSWCKVQSPNATISGYCMDKDLSCSPSLFRQPREMAPLEAMQDPLKQMYKQDGVFQ